MDLAGKPVLRRTVDAFASHPGVNGIVVVVGPGDVDVARSILSDCPKVERVVTGGHFRQESVAIGLSALKNVGANNVLVHDGARPLVTHDIIDRCLTALDRYSAAIAAVPLSDTLKQIDQSENVIATVDRSSLWLVQTPQGFNLDVLIQAHQRAQTLGFVGTDDATLLEEFFSGPVHIVLGSPENIKLTYPADLHLAESILFNRANRSATRVGTGYDIHRLVAGRKLFLGGIEIKDSSGLGLLGHSDADVLLHAICDAILGAAGQSDIGHLFPDTDPEWKDASSIELLRVVGRRITEAGFSIVNVDATVVAERPRVSPYVPVMRRAISSALGISEESIGIKATTNEGIGAIGEGLGIAAHAVAGVIRLT